MEQDPDFIAVIGGNIDLYNLDGSNKENPNKIIMMNYLRLCGEGIENRIRAWSGIHYIHGEIIYEDVDSQVSLYDRTHLLACHNAWEWSRPSTFPPEIYKYAKEIGDVPSE